MDTCIENLFEKLRLEIRGLYQESKANKPLDETQLSSYNALVINIPDPGPCIMSANHQARKGKNDNKICNEWSSLKFEMDLKVKKILGKTVDQTKVCVCCIKDLSSDHIYGEWNGSAWRCQNEKEPGSYGPILTIEEIRKKIKKPSTSKQR